MFNGLGFPFPNCFFTVWRPWDAFCHFSPSHLAPEHQGCARHCSGFSFFIISSYYHFGSSLFPDQCPLPGRICFLVLLHYHTGWIPVGLFYPSKGGRVCPQFTMFPMWLSLHSVSCSAEVRLFYSIPQVHLVSLFQPVIHPPQVRQHRSPKKPKSLKQ